jgi:hypothetical protein
MVTTWFATGLHLGRTGVMLGASGARATTRRWLPSCCRLETSVRYHLSRAGTARRQLGRDALSSPWIAAAGSSSCRHRDLPGSLYILALPGSPRSWGPSPPSVASTSSD